MARQVLDAVQRQNRRERRVLTVEEAKACPFCGEQPTLEPYHFTGPAKWTVTCWGNQGQNGVDCSVAPSSHGPTRAMAIGRWNHRAPGA
jgi:hypothetical protein